MPFSEQEINKHMIYVGQKDFDDQEEKEDEESKAQPVPLYIVKVTDEEALKHNKAMEQKHKIMNMF